MPQKIVTGGGGALSHIPGLSHTTALQKSDGGFQYGSGLCGVSNDFIGFRGSASISLTTIQKGFSSVTLAGSGGLQR